ncbi:hypothetical protein KI688_009188 [Linnemannia hyalina]|uniref:Reverse transcriptase zinc-binding domain-containing protein n=1 Tax=Linnemannia hyalina TaxID=64524 RepID=A0A9P8BW32_9FUNG|nr:hypothetical protein KI688_009188 [Linnemannia hyalina]
MDRIFRPVWTDEAKTEDRLEFIPTEERSVGHRTHSRLEENTRRGHFKAHPALRRALDNDGLFGLMDDLAERINGIAINTSENGTFELVSPHAFRQMIFSKSYRPPTPAPHHPPMVAPPPPLTATVWTSFWNNNARNTWWRLLINKLPSGLHLHSIIRDMVEHLCWVCGTDLETSRHLLFSFPKKLEVWHGALSRYVEERTWTADYICSLFFPDPDPVKPLHDIPIFILIGTILASVWRYHHAFVRKD